MTNKLVVIINSLKVPKIKKLLLYEIKFLVPNYSCLQNPWLGGYRPQIPVLSVLCPQLNLLNPPTEQNSWIRHWQQPQFHPVALTDGGLPITCPHSLFRRVREIAEKRLLALSLLSIFRLSVRPHGTTHSAPTGRIFMKFGIWVFCENLSRNIQVWLKSDNNNRHFTWSPMYIFLSYLAQFFLEWEMFQIKVVQKIKTHILCSVTFLRKSCRLWDNVEKYNRVGQATDDNMTHAHCVLDTLVTRHTSRTHSLLLCS